MPKPLSDPHCRVSDSSCIGPFPNLPLQSIMLQIRIGRWRQQLSEQTKPIGELTLRTLAMPADANAAGDIFGGWVMAQMDLSCGIRAAERARGRVVTAAVKEMAFAKPVKIGDTLCVYTHIDRVGRTSITLKVEAWAQRYLSDLMERVTHADFVMVALDKGGNPTPVPGER
jgi:acyl-CoA thioesterase YciA